MTHDSLFREKAPGIMRLLMKDFEFSVLDAAAVVGNLGHESGGFKFLQEKKPLVPGSKGGYGWAQWTGPRRRAYEDYCSRNNLDPASDKANYGFLFVELKGSEKKAVWATKSAKTLYDKVVAFELGFERAGIKHYDKRLRWAEIALAAYNSSNVVKLATPAAIEPAPKAPEIPKPAAAPAKASTGVLAALAGILKAMFAKA